MAIVFNCSACGKKISAPDSGAGRTGTCPGCGGSITVPQASVEDEIYDAEVVAEEPARPSREQRVASAFEEFARSKEEEYEPEQDEYDYEERPRQRRPMVDDQEGEATKECPMCGETIKAAARKCRYCGEVFDGAVRPSGAEDSAKEKKFRKLINGLGGLWIFLAILFTLGGLALAAGAGPQRGQQQNLPPEVGFILLALGICLLVFGISAVSKQIWAVYAGLVVSYLFLASNIAGLFIADGGKPGVSICGFVIWIASIVQSHQTLNAYKELRRPSRRRVQWE